MSILPKWVTFRDRHRQPTTRRRRQAQVIRLERARTPSEMPVVSESSSLSHVFTGRRVNSNSYVKIARLTFRLAKILNVRSLRPSDVDVLQKVLAEISQRPPAEWVRPSTNGGCYDARRRVQSSRTQRARTGRGRGMAAIYVRLRRSEPAPVLSGGSRAACSASPSYATRAFQT